MTRDSANTLRDRRAFIGGSDARIILGDNEAALLRLWREKRGEVEPEDLSSDLLIQLGTVTEHLNRHWFEKNTGHVVTEVQRRVHSVHYWMGATLDRSRQLARSLSHFRFRGLRNRTPSPPPFSSRNSIPAASIARCSFACASSETRGPNPPSKRLTVGRDSLARAASSD
jgi:hypothetical protein